jgi:hypothetical protein
MISKIRFFLIFSALITVLVSSCKKTDDTYNPLHIDAVWTNMLDTVPHVITSAYLSQWIRVNGTGFTGLQAVLCNGISVSVYPTYVTDTDITFQLPSSLLTGDDVTIDSLNNTIMLVTNHGSVTYNFIIRDENKEPSITSVSYTMPNVGDSIYLIGSYLSHTTEVYFPAESGYVSANFRVINKTRIKVQVPVGAGAAGAIKHISDEAAAAVFSPQYMYYKTGIFLHSFKESAMVSGGYGNLGFYDATSLAAATGLSSNPDSAVSIPVTETNVAVATGNDVKVGYFKFLANIGFTKVIDNGGSIVGTTSLENLAVQFDLYMNQPWKSGAIALRMNKNVNGANASYIYNITPWTSDDPVNFDDGWTTVTVPFSSFKDLALGTLTSYISTIKTNSYQSLFGFFNYDENSDGHTPTALTSFRMFVANVRLVRTNKPTE